MMRIAILLGLLTLMIPVTPASADALDDLARDVWAWRAVQQPASGDDIPRIERPAGWAPDWSQPAVARMREQLAALEARWKAIDPSGWPVPRQVDYRLIGSALARVRWELDIQRGWRRDPQFYVQQTLGVVYEALLQPPPFDAGRAAEIERRLSSIPATLLAARANLDQAVAPFAKLAIDELAEVGPRLRGAIDELAPLLLEPVRPRVKAPVELAVDALEAYRVWLQSRIGTMPAETAVGRDNYVWFLKNVAILPYTPEQLLEMGRREWERAVAFETYERQRNLQLPELPLFKNQAAQAARAEQDEQRIRQMLGAKGILTVPAWMRHYRNLPLPKYLALLGGLGVADDLTSESRLGEHGTSYIRPPAPTLPYFNLSTARDPRPIIVHEGVPGHYFQLALSWAHEDPIRRRYYDSSANEGIGFYAEEMMLQAGLFDDKGRSREIIYNFMRLRALRVEVDVKLALGTFSIVQAAEYLRTTVPMDVETAREEAASFAAGPGQAISYQIGKLQILEMLADARQTQGNGFTLQAFHDFVWRNGNVPIALQRWEYLGRQP